MLNILKLTIVHTQSTMVPYNTLTYSWLIVCWCVKAHYCCLAIDTMDPTIILTESSYPRPWPRAVAQRNAHDAECEPVPVAAPNLVNREKVVTSSACNANESIVPNLIWRPIRTILGPILSSLIPQAQHLQAGPTKTHHWGPFFSWLWQVKDT